tara:strand:+ start:242 stop:448 length:207 start_codon:yes stop_codon:yes gene_type:complete
MEFLDFEGSNFYEPIHDSSDGTVDKFQSSPSTLDLQNTLQIAHIANGVDPLEAALKASLQVPLIKPFL